MSMTTELIGLRGVLDDDIQIMYRKENMPRVSSSTLIFWNKGRETINEGDIINEYPLEVVFPQGVQVLRSTVRKTTRPPIDFRVVDRTRDAQVPENIVRLNFTFLDQKDGARIEILHTGDNSTQLKIQGAIRGARKGMADLGSIVKRRWGRFGRYMIFVAFLAFWGAILASMGIITPTIVGEVKPLFLLYIGLVIIAGTFTGAIIGYIIPPDLRRYPNTLIRP